MLKAKSMRLIIATKNKDKVREIRDILSGMPIEVLSLLDLPDIVMPEENGSTFIENARIKADYVAGLYPSDLVLADDSGLVVDALDGAPGVISARYGGVQGDYKRNNERLLIEMKKVDAGRRSAAFICAMVLRGPGNFLEEVEGKCDGKIAFEPRGSNGFGYDPLFFLTDKDKTMAELLVEEKNQLSHRGRALKKLKRVFLDIFSKNK